MIDGHGDDSYKYSRPITANFSSNVYSKVNLSRLKAHLCECIGEIGNYPEPEPYTLEARIASRCQLPSGAVCVTNGATEAIYLIAQTFRGTNTAILQPTFSEYADACRMHGHRVSSLYQLPKEQDGYRLPDDVRMLWLCNPNNPTGTVADKEYMRGLIEHNPQVCFIIDQSYEFFTLCPLFSPAEAAEYPNVLLLHSMTKRYAIPGLRLGYVTGSSGLLERLRTNRMPWSVNRLAIEAGLFLLENDARTGGCGCLFAGDGASGQSAQNRRRIGRLGYADAFYAGAASHGQGVCLERVSCQGAWHTYSGCVQLCGAGRALFPHSHTDTGRERQAGGGDRGIYGGVEPA